MASESEVVILREDWLTKASVLINEDVLKKTVVRNVYTPLLVPESVRFSCSWIKGRQTKKAVGVCFSQALSAGGVNEIFITPTMSDSLQVAETLIHELIHAMDNNKSGHLGYFKEVSEAVGLVGKRTATVAGEELRGKLVNLVDRLGEYPHFEVSASSRLSPSKTDPTAGEGGKDHDPEAPSDGAKKQKNRQLKVSCACGFIIRLSQKRIDEVKWKERECLKCVTKGGLVPSDERGSDTKRDINLSPDAY